MKNSRGRRLLASSALLVSGLAAAACSDDWAPHPHVALPAGQCPPAAQGQPTSPCFDVIADFETPYFAMVNGRSGGWFTYDDMSLNGPDGGPSPAAIQYAPGAEVVPAHQTFPPMSPSGKALHAQASAYPGSFGSGLGTNLHSVPNPGGYHAEPYDASRYDGVILWAKRGSTPGVSSSVRVQITTVATDSDYASHFGSGSPLYGATTKDARACDPNPGSTVRCDDDYSIVLSLLSDWGEPFKFTWSDLHQQGFGRVPPEGFSPKELITIKFTNAQGQAFDEWFDDIAFYKQ
jgi:hypothetical protein